MRPLHLASSRSIRRQFAWVGLLIGLMGSSARAGEPGPITAPPAAVFARFRPDDQDAARAFYGKYLDVGGVAILASSVVDDEALRRTHAIVSHLLVERPDILAVMALRGTRLIIIGRDQVYTDMPEYRDEPDPAYINERVRGTGGLDVTSFGEENLLNLAGDRYDDESIGLHEFCHTIDAALGQLDAGWKQRLRDAYRDSVASRGLWKFAYAAGNPAEYWAELCQSYFGCNRINNWNHNSIATREQLKEYDPGGYNLIRSTFRLKPGDDWTLPPLRPQPSVVPPPARFHLDPYYTKFTFAREFPVVGSDRVADEALLRANDTIRKLFAYRHDVLKALIADGVRLVVLGRGELPSDLPEFRADPAATAPGADLARFVAYQPDRKILVVPEENIIGPPSLDPLAGQSAVIAVLARAVFAVTADRPVDPTFDQRPRKQQYELRVRRLDADFGARVRQAFDAAGTKNRWRGTAAARDPAAYWTAGVLAYSDAGGDPARVPAPNDADRPVVTRATLRAYDPDLYAIIDEVLAYGGHSDWRYARPDC